ncbi:DNA primase [Thalassospira sp. SN3W]|uniref:DNA primase n=1 Tax=Thalassospira xiamenensis M-5 = DSM 17429 TaxID=1123366 RepID=A0AB72UGL5_9PROT|nr:DNA primase [Thalassospira xiamenensis]AJD53367.1 DNA primase [Thalassospira xiamenensis M-5 = DSM 17429]SIT30299.1 DNA primase [Thalassospira xiamenensis M-5 = DSM 17429]
MSFPQSFLDDLRARVGLADIVGTSVKLIKRGREYSGLCPFHSEKSPSFTVNEQKGFYHCFGCGAHGDVISFVMNTRGLTFVEAVEVLANQVGMDVPKPSREAQEREKKAKTLYEVMEAACVFYERVLHMPEGRDGLEYFRRRGLDDKTIADFRLGFAPDNRGALKAALKREEFDESLMIEAGLLIEPEDQGRQTYDRFRGRVMFPILDRRGRVVAFGGRVMGDTKPKYLNSPDTPLFHKGQLLYGLPQAREASQQDAPIIVTEGYMDVIALHRAGFRGAVAPLGTAVTEEQIGELWKMTNEPILCLDGDAAGKRAAVRAAERALPILRPGKSLLFSILPEGEDPDSLMAGANGFANFRKILDMAVPLAELVWRMEVAGRATDTPERRAALEADIQKRISAIGDDAVRSQYQSMFRDRIWQLFKGDRATGGAGRAARSSGTYQNKKFARGGKGGKKDYFWEPAGKAVPGMLRPPMHKRRSLQDCILLVTLINHPHLHDDVGERLGIYSCADSELDNLRRAVLKLLDGDPGLDSDAIKAHLERDGLSETVLRVVGADILAHAAFARPETPLERARAGWEQVFSMAVSSLEDEEAKYAVRQLAADISEEEWERFSHRRDDLARRREKVFKLDD